MREQGKGSGRTGDGAHDARGDRHLVEQVDVSPPGLAVRQGHAALCFVALGAVPDTLDQLDVGQAVLRGERRGELRRALRDVVRAAAGDREVVPANDDVAAINLAHAHDECARQEVAQVLFAVVLIGADQRTGLEEGVVVEELVDPLADGVAAAAVLAFDAVRSAHLLGEFFDVVDFLNRAQPVLSRLPRFACLVSRHSEPFGRCFRSVGSVPPVGWGSGDCSNLSQAGAAPW